MKNILIAFAILIVIQANAQTVKDYIADGSKKFQSNDYEGALKQFNLAIELEPNMWNLYLIRGMIKIPLKNQSTKKKTNFNID